MLRVALCDDERNTLLYYEAQLDELLSRMGIVHTIDTFSDSGKLLSELYFRRRWDVYFLDIDMPLIDGLSLGQKIHDIDANAYLNYVSIHTEKVYESFKTRPFRFIPKDQFQVYIEDCIKDIMQDMQKTKDKQLLLMETHTNSFTFPMDAIMFIQSMDKYVKVHMADGKVSESIRYRLSDLEDQLLNQGFIRTHKSYLVNYNYIRKILPSGVVLDNGLTLPISRSRVAEIKTIYRGLIL